MIQFGVDFSTNGIPETGLSPTITIRDTSDGSVVVNGAAMTEVGGGAYKYDFSNDTAKKYSAVMDGGVDTLDSRYMTAWSERAKAEAEVIDILEDSNELQGNQSNWLTATGFASSADMAWMIKIITNKKELKKTGDVWSLIIYNDDNVTPILSKEIKDSSGNNITDLAAGVLAQELASSV